ncbi:MULTISPECIES: hypothetical protein [unclassified Shewanella]|uniref:hypothetical protein n=1 Tax=unclassified Shewanella TaxID=196818 RepID=UPI001BC3F228|nr:MULTISPECIES: hypothetical protein [unclassified Shewanella]GIU07305.1 hypothetical protein TUM4444_06600 [Shewanella sp. MBTL60-112-B1]GIU35697.1 hypothetical protein TUM4445_25840 [Shewanella sp. MBTL60-112-B2]
MEALIRFGYGELGTPKMGALVVLLFIFLFKVIKSRIDRGREEKTTRISEMISEIEKNSSPKYHFTVEQIFQNRFGVLIDYPVINFFLKSKTPTSDILSYIKGRRYIEFCDDYKKIRYKEKITTNKLIFKKWLLLAGYFASSFIAVGLIIITPQLPIDNTYSFPVYLIFILSAFIWAYLSLDEGIKPESAILLHKKYNDKINKD